MADNNSFAELITNLKNLDSIVRGTAAKELGQLGDRRAVEALIQTLKNDPSGWVKGCAALALGRLGDQRAVTALVEAYHDHDVVSGADQRCVCDAAKDAIKLIAVGDLQDVNGLIAALKDYDSDVRWYAAQGLGNLKNPIAIEPLSKALHDKNGKVRYFSAWALGEIGDARVLPLLEKVPKKDRGGWVGGRVREAAKRASKKIIERELGVQ